jgi:hypothetical protein|tara:strand:- start:74 stop:262 length:189 start_codon:yes stop_codon:yes gene_type:complete
MLKLTQQDALDQIWNEAYEIFADMEDLNDEELLQCRLNIKGRAKHIMRLSNLEQYRKDEGWL